MSEGNDVRRLRSSRFAGVVAATVLLAPAGWAFGAQPPRLDPHVERGAQLAREKCSACHAVALETRSPEHDAPLFRVLSRLYSAPDLQRKLGDMADHGHFEMPVVQMREDEIADLAAYIASLDGGAPPRPPPPRKRGSPT